MPRTERIATFFLESKQRKWAGAPGLLVDSRTSTSMPNLRIIQNASI